MPRRQVEIFSAGCPLCEETIYLIREVGRDLCDITILDVRDETVADRARALQLRSFPAVFVDGERVSFDMFAALSRALAESEWFQQFLKTLDL